MDNPLIIELHIGIESKLLKTSFELSQVRYQMS